MTNSQFHILVVGNGSKALCEKFGECCGSRVRCAGVEDEFAEDLDVLKSACRAADRFLGSRVDAVLVLWKSASRKSVNFVFSMTESFRTCKDRVYLCPTQETLDSLVCAPPNLRFEAQSAIIFFAGRTLMLDNPGLVLKTLLKSKFKGSSVQLDILGCDDFINGAIERRNARKKVFEDAAADDIARLILEKRFSTKMGCSFSVVRERIVA